MRGRETKKGVVGDSAQYITRTGAINKLQITLKDFRRLCILKGIYPREPKRKLKGHDKTYYHKKDIRFLAHEPVLQKFREIKTFLKRLSKAKGRNQRSECDRLNEHRPTYRLDHLVLERYPTFVDALRDLDDPLTLVHLFAVLPGKVDMNRGARAKDPSMYLRMAREWQQYVVKAGRLTKVFVSIKGIYYQVLIKGQEITWIVPHELSQRVPSDVDFRVMSTFLEFYCTLMKFVNFKLYNELGMRYPPPIDVTKENSGAGLESVLMQTKKNSEQGDDDEDEAAPTNAVTQSTLDDQKKIQAEVNAVVKNLGRIGEDDEQDVEMVDVNTNAASENDDDDNDMEEFARLANEVATDNVSGAQVSPEEQDLQRASSVFAGLTFLLNREVAQNALEFVLSAGGARVIRMTTGMKDSDLENEKITHVVFDRPKLLTKKVEGRVYVQPQWVFDSFNTRTILPNEPYGVGVVPPPHLSPFVDDVAEGYIPKQRRVLEAWGANRLSADVHRGGQGDDSDNSGDMQREDDELVDDDDEEEDEEAQYQMELAKEREGVAFSEMADVVDEDEDSAEESGSSSDDDDSDVVLKKDEESDEEKQLRMIMMSKKQARLYSRMQYGLKKKADKNQELKARRRAIEKQQKKGGAELASGEKRAASEVSEGSSTKRKRKKRKKAKRGD